MGFKQSFMLASFSLLGTVTALPYDVAIQNPKELKCFDGGVKPRIYEIDELVKLQLQLQSKGLGPLPNLNLYLLEDKDAGMDGDVTVAFKADGYKKEQRARPVCDTASANMNVQNFMKTHELYSHNKCELHLFIPAVAKTKPYIERLSCSE